MSCIIVHISYTLDMHISVGVEVNYVLDINTANNYRFSR